MLKPAPVPKSTTRIASTPVRRLRHCCAFLIFALWSLLQCPFAVGAAIPVTAVRVSPEKDRTRVTIESATPVSHHLLVLKNPDRVVLDLDDVAITPALKELAGKIGGADPYVKGVRIGRFKPGVVRLVFDLKGAAKTEVFTLKASADEGDRLVLEVYSAEAIEPVAKNDSNTAPDVYTAQVIEPATKNNDNAPLPVTPVVPRPVVAAAPGLPLFEVLRAALEQSPNVLLQQQQVVSSEGSVLQAQGQFDPVYNASAGRQHGLRPLRADEVAQLQGAGIFGVDRQTTSTTNWSAGLTKNTLTGVTLGGNLSVASVDDTAQSQFLIPTQTTGTLVFTAKVPLLKNLGRDTVGAGLFAAQDQYKAAAFDLAHTNAQSLLSVTFAYWDYLAKLRTVEIAVASEQRARTLIDEVTKLVKADQVPRAELELLLASRAEKTTQRVQAEQALTQARQTLGRAAGLPAERSLALPLPQDDFPAFSESTQTVVAIEKFMAQAVRDRADLEANRLRQAAARYLVVAARNNLKPQVDLNVNVGYSTLLEGRGPYDVQRLLYQERVGPVAGFTISGQWPQGNNSARGTLLTQSAVYDSSSIQLRELEASVANNVAVDFAALQRAAAELGEADEGVRRYVIALNNEQIKRRLGQATLIDVITIQDRLDAARLLQVQVRQTYANAIAQFRFDLGALVHRSGEAFDVRVNDLLYGEVRSE